METDRNSCWMRLGIGLSCVVLFSACEYIDLDPVGFEFPGNGDTETSGGEAVCGNGIVEGDEMCDDGINDGSEGECAPGCVLPELGYCGDGVLQPELGEECDEGDNNGIGACTETCMHGIVIISPCGDGVVWGDEECDDGNTLSGDGCSDECRLECGFLCDDDDPGMPCEPDCDVLYDQVSFGLCTNSPAIVDCCDDELAALLGRPCDVEEPVCGNGIIEPGEMCDDGINDGGEGECAPGCVLPDFGYCGDGILQPELGEQCDFGEENGTGACTEACMHGIVIISPCGDGVVWGDEECDDGNTLSGDGCSDECQLECGFLCDDNPGMPCEPDCDILFELVTQGRCTNSPDIVKCCDDDLAALLGRPCDSIEIAVCGDGIVNGDEMCDDGVNDGGEGECAPGCVL